MTNVAAKEKPADVLESRILDKDYQKWKRDTPYLYDFVMTHSQEWPSLTVEWLPTVRNLNDRVAEHSLLLGTHTNCAEKEQNYLVVVACTLPREEAAVETTVSSYNRSPNDDVIAGKFEIKMKIKHEGEVNRARHMPQNHSMIASRGPSEKIYFWDFEKHDSFPAEHSFFRPEGYGIGHSKEGFPLEWSKKKEGFLLSGSEDTTVQLWDISALGSAPGSEMNSIATFRGHTMNVEDVDWHSKDENMFASVGDDKIINIWDLRNTEKASQSKVDAHEGDIHGVAFNPTKEYVFATASADKTVKLWDLRMTSPTNTLIGHTDQVYKVEWDPYRDHVLASCSADRRIAIWDLKRFAIDRDAEHVPPELLFLHRGHTSIVSDFSWNAREPWIMASVAEDNVLQVWNIAEEIYKRVCDDSESSGEESDDFFSEDEDGKDHEEH